MLNPSTSISFALPQNGRVILEVFSITGQKVGTLVNETLNAGNHTIHSMHPDYLGDLHLPHTGWEFYAKKKDGVGEVN